MEGVNIPHPTLNRIVRLLYFLRIWNDCEASTSREKIRKRLYLSYFLLFQIFLAVCTCVAVERNEFIFLFLILIIVGVITLKLVYLLYKQNEIEALLHFTTEHRVNDDNVKIKPFLNFVNGYIFMLIVAAVFYNVSSLPALSAEKRLPFFIRYSLTWKHTEIIYWILFVFDGLGIFYSNLSNVITPIVWYLLLIYGVKYEELGDQFRQFGMDNHQTVKAAATGRNRQKDSSIQELIGLVKVHRNLFKNVQQFRSCFATLFMVQMCTSGTSVCVSTYNLAYNSQNNFFQMVIYIAVMLYAFFDIFLVMYLANEIKIASNRLSYCLFESNWMKQSQACQKCMIMVCENLKKPQEMVIGFYPMNLQTFGMIIKGAYTLFNLIQTLD